MIENKAGKDSWLGSKQITITSLYSGCQTIGGIKVDLDKFISHVSNNNLSNELAQNLKVIKTKKEFENLTENYPDEDLEIFSKYFSSSCNWSSFADQYIYNQIITPNLPNVIYYDEYYQLPSRI